MTSQIETAREAPGPRAWPVLGNVGALRGVLPFMERQWALHGDVFRIRVGSFSAVVVAHPDQLQRVLVGNRRNYVKGGVYDGLRQVIGNGMVTLEGEPWRERRTLAQPSFHRHALEKLAAIMVASGDDYFARLSVRCRAGLTVDLHEEMVRLTMEVVVNALFGRGTIEGSDVSYRALGDSLEFASSGANALRLPEWVPTPRNLKFQRTMRELDANVMQIIRAARERPSEGTLLAMLLDARDELGQPLSDRELRDEVLTLFIAGHETTALTLTWLFSLLAERPEVLARMREEVDAVLAGRDPAFADVAKLRYLRQVVDETLRLRPPVAMVARDALGDDTLGDYAIRAGEVAIPFFWGAHRHRDFWSEPERFEPERFAGAKERHSYCYLPFSGGPRICIGNAFSLTETVLLLAQVLTRFSLEVQPTTGLRPVSIGTVRPSRPVRVRFAPRVGYSAAAAARARPA